MDLGPEHAALRAEHRRVVEAEREMRLRLSVPLSALACAAESADPLSMGRWSELGRRRQVLEQAIDALVNPRASTWNQSILLAA